MIKFDFNNVMASRIGACHGVSENEITEVQPLIAEAFREFDQGNWGFRELPYAKDLVATINKLAAEVAGKCENLVVIGIGGSSLGNRTLHRALNHPFYNMLSAKERDGRPRVFVQENVDPDSMRALLDVIDVSRTVFNVITKSGGTAETMSNFMILRQQLIDAVGEDKHRERIILTTDPVKGTLRQMANDLGYRSLALPSNVGGRYSVFSTVGLFSAAVSGIDIAAILAGAREMDRLCQNKDIWKNPACLAAVLQYLLYRKGRTISVLMPYCDQLLNLSEWYAQLWAESLGKRTMKAGRTTVVGSTPVKALGVIDQHSQLQLYMEGPEDKVIRFIRVENFRETVKIPKMFAAYQAVSYLGGRSLNELINAEQQGTELALTKAQRPNCTIKLDRVTPDSLGALMYMLEVETAFIGQLFKIDPFNQPGVEAGKQITKALLGCPGYEQQKKEIKQLPELNVKYCI